MAPPLPASTSRRERSVSTDTVLVPKMTKFDERVLSKLDVWDVLDREKQTVWRTPWEVAELLREDDVATVRRTLRGLDDFQHSISTGYGHNQRWARRPAPKEDTDV